MSIIKILFKSKFKFFPPRKKKILVFDYNNYYKLKILNFFHHDHEILHTRFEKINIYIILKNFLKFKFSFFDYLQEYVNYVNPKLLITLNDNNLKFYKLNCKNGKKIFIQQGKRSEIKDIFSELKKDKNKNKNYVDYMFTFNENISRLYRKYVSGKTIPIGSIESNDIKIKIKNNNRKKILLISDFYEIYLEPNKNLIDKIKFNIFLQKEKKLLKELNLYIKKNNLKIDILSRFSGKKFDQEKNYYQNIFPKNQINLIKNDPQYINKFQIIDKYNLVIGFDSTLMVETFGRGLKVLIINFKSSLKKELVSYDLFWPQKQKRELDFFLNDLSTAKFRQKLDKLLSLNDLDWKKNHYTYKNKIMNYSYKNRILNNTLNKLVDEKTI